MIIREKLFLEGLCAQTHLMASKGDNNLDKDSDGLNTNIKSQSYFFIR